MAMQRVVKLAGRKMCTLGTGENTEHAQRDVPIASSTPPSATTQTAHEQEPRTAPTYHGDDAAAALASAGMARFTSADDDGWM